MVDLGKDTLDLHSRLQTEKQPYMHHLDEIRELVLADRRRQTGGDETKGEDRREFQYDSTAERSLEQGSASMVGIVANPFGLWCRFGCMDDSDEKDPENREWLDFASRTILNHINDPHAMFYQSLKPTMEEIMGFGTASMIVEESARSLYSFKPNPLASFNIAANADGYIDTMSRELRLSARAIMQKEKDGWNPSKQIRDAAKDKPLQEYTLIQVIRPRDEVRYDKQGQREPGRQNLPIALILVEKGTGHVVLDDGKFENPAPVGRWTLMQDEIYGRGCGSVALADIKMVNASSQGHILAMEMSLFPPLEINSASGYGQIDLSPHAININASMENGKPGIQPIMTVGNLPMTMEYEELRRRYIEQAFFIDLFREAREAKMTLGEYLGRESDRGRILAPAVGSVQAELIGPIMERCLGIAIRKGIIPLPPKRLMGAQLKVKFKSEIQVAQQSSELRQISEWIGDVANVAQADPGILDNVNGDSYVRRVHAIRGLPEDLLHKPEDVKAIREMKAQQAQQAQALQSADMAAGAAQKANQAGLI